MVEELAVTQNPEYLGDDIKRFSSKACDYLEKRKLITYSLSGKSIEELENESGIKLALTNTIKVGSSEFKKQRSRRSEIAIDPKEFFLEETIDKPYDQLQRICDRLITGTPEVNGIIGTIVDYFELCVIHLEATGEDLFGIQNNYNVAVAEFSLDKSKIAIMGKLLRDNDSLIVMIAPHDFIYPEMMVAPLIVPNS